jgi:ribosomal protein S18 acetylase RimI-like enzyme
VTTEPLPPVGAFATVPSNDLAGAIRFWERLGFERAGGDAHYASAAGAARRT